MANNNLIEFEKSWWQQLYPLLILVISGSIASYLVPSVPNKTNGIFSHLNNVSFQQILILVLTTSLVVIYLAYFRARIYFSIRWLVAAVTYNFLLLLIKFTVSTNEISKQNQSSIGSILSLAAIVSLLYIFAFSIIYVFYNGKILSKSLHKSLILTTEGKLLLSIGVFFVASIARIVIFQLPIFSSTTASNYLNNVFKTNAILISALLFIMSFAVVEAYSQVRRRVDLKYFFISGLILILSIHLWWAIYIYKGYL